MNKFAQLLYGKVVYIYETTLEKKDLPRIFKPSAYWVDVTGQDVEMGDIASFDKNLGIIFTKPEQDEMTELEKNKYQLTEQYETDKDIIIKYYIDAILHDDTKTMEELKREMAKLDEQFDNDYNTLKSNE